MKTFRLSEPIVVTSWFAAFIVAVVWVACPPGGLLTVQAAGAPAAAAVGQSPAEATPTAALSVPDLPSQLDPNVQVLTQAPVHEAFGQPVLFNPGPSPVIPKQPPNPVEELPPSLKPAGDNVRWIPGYWSWEAVQQKFVWTSGMWRVIPPGLAWTPGYWTQCGTGYQFVSGFWRRSGTTTESSLVANQTGAGGSNLASPGGGNRDGFFKSRIQTVLIGTCAKCHGSKKSQNHLRLDSRAALLKGGDSGPAVVPGDPDKSLLIQAVRYTGDIKMPPNKKLPANVTADFERWVRDGAVWPDDVRPVGGNLQQAALQPLQKADSPAASSGIPAAAATSAAPGNVPVSADVSVAAAGEVPPGGSSILATPTGVGGSNLAAPGGGNRDAFFKSRIQTVLIGTCAKCHGSKKSQNHLRLDSRAALLKGGDSGPAVVPGDADKSLLIQAVRYTGDIKMPPNKKLPANVIADFERWVRDGAAWPDDVRPGGSNPQQAALQPAQKADSPAASSGTAVAPASSGTPVAAATSIPPGNAPVSADAPVALTGDLPNVGAVPGPVPTATDPVPAVAAAPTPAVPTPTDPAATAAAPTTADPPATAALNPAAVGPSPAGAAGTLVAPATAAPPAAAVVPIGKKVASSIFYLPQPPASLESGPLGNPPTADFTWIPGTWIYRHGRYLWLAGQWAPVHRGWIWVPARYVWTPAGHVFVDGYWDYELAQRGVLFAPVTFRHNFPVWGFVHRPSVVINTRRLTEFLFVNGPQGCYCFGDYFGASDIHAGIFPGFAFHMSSLGYDPFFAFSSWAHHRDIGWHEKLVADYRALRDDARLRPPRTFDDLVAQHRNLGKETEPFALPFDKFAARGGPSSLRFEKVSKAERDEIERSLRSSRELERRRFEFETRLSRRESINREGKIVENRDRRESRFEERRDSRFEETRRDSRFEDTRKDSKREDRRDSKFEDTRRDSKITDDRRNSKIEERRDSNLTAQRGKPRESSAGRTPPVVPRRPVSTSGLRQRAIQEHPAERLANPRFVPQASNRGRSEPSKKGSEIRHP